MFALMLLATSTWAATEKKLHNFHDNGTDGTYPAAGLIMDGEGNLYGTTRLGGDNNSGTVFELTPNGSGGWTEKKLHNFGNGTDGVSPEAGLIFDAAGNLYGTTSGGGDHQCGDSGCGTVFEMTPNGSGGWTEKKLHNFGNGTDGSVPLASLIFDAEGNLYGTTTYGGSHNAGTVFEMTPNGSGGWTEKKLHNFGSGTDGTYPVASLVFDAAGNLYGTTRYGGNYLCASSAHYGCGTVFEMTPNGSGGWTEKKLHNFGINTADGAIPLADLIFDAAGNLYGTTTYGGNFNLGTAFEMTPNGSGGWTEKKLYNFGVNGSDGTYPYVDLIFDAVGNLYGTTGQGGSHNSGTAFKLTPGSGGWTETKLHNFNNNGTDGTYPDAGLIFDGAGNLYGTTSAGGDYNNGTVFEITP